MTTTTTTTRANIELDDATIEELFTDACGYEVEINDLTFAAASEETNLLAAAKGWREKGSRFELTTEDDGVRGHVWCDVQATKGQKRRTVCALILGDALVVEGLDAGWAA